MKHFLKLSLVALAAVTVSFKEGRRIATSGKNRFDENPFFSVSSLPYYAPDFRKIKDTDFKPALEQGMRLQLQEIDKIANSK